ncbi:hypothetical protein HDV05_002668 [Chytridiales sp. JEL 0842]|nr:hypothetical protein HDV05_002668 [Chytridiales sp. JEL 0842]
MISRPAAKSVQAAASAAAVASRVSVASISALNLIATPSATRSVASVGQTKASHRRNLHTQRMYVPDLPRSDFIALPSAAALTSIFLYTA